MTRPVAICHAYWCRRPAAPGSILCIEHTAALPPHLATTLAAAVDGAVAYLAAERMRKAVATLPKDVQERMRRDTIEE